MGFSLYLSNHVEKDPNWMTTTDGVSKPEIEFERLSLSYLNSTLLLRFPALFLFNIFSLSLHFFSSHSDVLNFGNYLSGKDGRKPQGAGSRNYFLRKGASPFQVAGKPRSIKPLNKVHAL